MKFFRPTVFASLFCCFLFYTGIFVPSEQNPFYSLVETEKINFLQGEILSNPVKSASGKTYSFTLKVNNAGITEKDFYTRTFLDFSDYENYLKNIESGFFSSAEGNVKILFSSTATDSIS